MDQLEKQQQKLNIYLNIYFSLNTDILLPRKYR